MDYLAGFAQFILVWQEEIFSLELHSGVKSCRYITPFDYTLWSSTGEMLPPWIKYCVLKMKCLHLMVFPCASARLPRLMQALPAVVYALLAGSWSDSHGRKSLIIFSSLGYIINNLVFIVSAHWWYELKAEYLLFECLQDCTGEYWLSCSYTYASCFDWWCKNHVWFMFWSMFIYFLGRLAGVYDELYSISEWRVETLFGFRTRVMNISLQKNESHDMYRVV